MEESIVATTNSQSTINISNNNNNQPISIVDQWRIDSKDEKQESLISNDDEDELMSNTNDSNQFDYVKEEDEDEDADADDEDAEGDNQFINESSSQEESLKPLVSTTTGTPPPPLPKTSSPSLQLPLGPLSLSSQPQVAAPPSLLPSHPYHPMLMMKMMMMNMEQQQQHNNHLNNHHLNHSKLNFGQFDLLTPPPPLPPPQMSAPLSSLIPIHNNNNGDQPNPFTSMMHQSPMHHSSANSCESSPNSGPNPSSLLSAAFESNPALLQYIAAANSTQCSPISSLAVSVAAAMATSAANKLRTKQESKPEEPDQAQAGPQPNASRTGRNGRNKVYSTNRRLVASTVTAPRYLPNGPSQTVDGKPSSENPIYRCHLCPYTGNSKLQFNAHMNTHFDHRCPHCDYTSRTEGRLKRHIRDFHSETPPETWSGNRIKSEDGSIDIDLAAFLDDDGMSAGGNGPNPARNRKYRCKQCGYVAVAKHDFWEHTRGHIKSDKMLSCPKCNFVTEYKHHLEYHLRNHFGSKPFKCAKCNYSCVNKSMLNSHMKSHSNIYQYRCEDCTYATKYCHSLKLHLRKYQHRPATVLNLDGTPNPYPVIDVYGTRRGPRPKRTLGPRNSRARRQNQPRAEDQPQLVLLNQAKSPEDNDPMMMNYDEEEREVEEDEEEEEMKEFIEPNDDESMNDPQNSEPTSAPSNSPMQSSANHQSVNNQITSPSGHSPTSSSSHITTTTSATNSSTINQNSQPPPQQTKSSNPSLIQSKSPDKSTNNQPNKSNSTTTAPVPNQLRCNYCPFQTESKPDFSNHLLNHVMNEKISSMMKMKNSVKVSHINNNSSTTTKTVDSTYQIQSNGVNSTNNKPQPQPQPKQSPPISPWPFSMNQQATIEPPPPVLPPTIVPTTTSQLLCANLNCTAPIDCESSSTVETSSFVKNQPLPTTTDGAIHTSKQTLAQTPLDLSGKGSFQPQPPQTPPTIFSSTQDIGLNSAAEIVPVNSRFINGHPTAGPNPLLNPTNNPNTTTISALLLMNSFLLNAQRNLKEVLKNGQATPPSGGDNNNYSQQQQSAQLPKLSTLQENPELFETTGTLSPNSCEISSPSPSRRPPFSSSPTIDSTIDRSSHSRSHHHHKRKGRANKVDLSQLKLNSFDSDQEDDDEEEEEEDQEEDQEEDILDGHELGTDSNHANDVFANDNDNRTNSQSSRQNFGFESEDFDELDDEVYDDDHDIDNVDEVHDDDDEDNSKLTKLSETLLPQLQLHQLPPTPTKSPKNPFDFSDRLVGSIAAPHVSTPPPIAQSDHQHHLSNLQSNTSALSQLFMQILQHHQQVAPSAVDGQHHLSSNNSSPSNLIDSQQQQQAESTCTATTMEETNSLIHKMYSATSLMQEILVEMCQVKK